MRAAVYVEQDKPLVIEDLEPTGPAPATSSSRSRPAACATPTSRSPNGTLPIPPPCILGHEGAGVVDWVGPEVSQVKPGDRVIASFVPACGSCWYCLHDKSNLCDGHGRDRDAPRAKRADGSIVRRLHRARHVRRHHDRA